VDLLAHHRTERWHPLGVWAAYNAVTEYVDHYSKARGGDDQSARALRAVTIGNTAQAMKANAFQILQTR
jgi:uncharacterized protein DUF932